MSIFSTLTRLDNFSQLALNLKWRLDDHTTMQKWRMWRAHGSHISGKCSVMRWNVIQYWCGPALLPVMQITQIQTDTETLPCYYTTRCIDMLLLSGDMDCCSQGSNPPQWQLKILSLIFSSFFFKNGLLTDVLVKTFDLQNCVWHWQICPTCHCLPLLWS